VDKQGKDIQHQTGNAVSTEADSENLLNLSSNSVLDLSGLSDQQIAELREQHASGMIDLQRKAAELKVDVGALDAALTSFNDQTAKATREGNSATITHVQTSSAGRTEVMIGNTDKAASGKISRAARGETDKTIWYVGIAAAAAVVVALIVSN